MYAVIRNPYRYTGTQCFTGHVESQHETLEQALAAERRSQRDCKRANGPHTYLDLRVIEVEWTDGERARGDARCWADTVDEPEDLDAANV